MYVCALERCNNAQDHLMHSFACGTILEHYCVILVHVENILTVKMSQSTCIYCIYTVCHNLSLPLGLVVHHYVLELSSNIISIM